MIQAKTNRHELRRKRTREAIISAAAEVFLKKGVANTSVADITETADVGYGTFYNHFHGLNDVVSAVAESTIIRVVHGNPGIRVLFDRTPAMERHGYPSDVAYAGLFLASDEAKYVTGANLAVDGGQSCKTGVMLGDAAPGS